MEKLCLLILSSRFPGRYFYATTLQWEIFEGEGRGGVRVEDGGGGGGLEERIKMQTINNVTGYW